MVASFHFRNLRNSKLQGCQWGSRRPLLWQSDEELDWAPFKVAFAQGLSRMLWSRASKHYCGGGLVGGADLSGVSAQLRRLKRHGKHEWYGAILTTVTGAQWPRVRLSDAGIKVDTTLCQRCGDQLEETMLHRCWQCSANRDVPACHRTDYLARRAVADAGNQPCVWLRGLVPQSWVELTPPPEDPGETIIGPVPDESWLWEGQLVAAGDASGGQYSSDNRLRRVGYAYTVLRAPGGLDIPAIDDLGFPTIATGALPGKSQTINRGELFAFLRFLCGTRGFSRALYIVDSDYVVKGVRRCVGGRRHSSNVDLWRAVAQEMRGREVICFKVESHMAVAEVIARRVPAGAFIANLMADGAAGRAAEACQLPYGEVEGLRWAESLLGAVRARLAAMFLSAVELDSRAPPPPTEIQELNRRSLRGRIAASKHTIERRGATLICTKCRGRALAAGSRAWLASPCAVGARTQDATRGIAVRVGHQTVHSSHAHSYHEGLALHYCSRCGAIARTPTRTALLRGLTRPCTGFTSRAGRCALRCILQGRLPSSLHAAKED